MIEIRNYDLCDCCFSTTQVLVVREKKYCDECMSKIFEYVLETISLEKEAVDRMMGVEK